MKTHWLIILFCIAINVYSQEKDSVFIENEVPYEKSRVWNFLDSLHNSNDYVLYFRIVTNWVEAIPKHPAFILTKSKNEFSAYKCTFQVIPGMSFQFTKLDLSQDSLLIVWKSYVDNKLFTMKGQRDLRSNCTYSVFDLGTYQFILLTKG